MIPEKPKELRLRCEGNVMYMSAVYERGVLHLKGPRSGMTTEEHSEGSLVQYECNFSGFYPCEEDGSEITLSRDQLFEMEGTPPAILPDGKAALLIRWPGFGDQQCGFQAPEEEDIRWYPLSSIIPMGGSLLVVERVS